MPEKKRKSNEDKLDALGQKLRCVVAETSPLTEEEIRLIREAAIMRAEQSMPRAEIEPEKTRDNELDP